MPLQASATSKEALAKYNMLPSLNTGIDNRSLIMKAEILVAMSWSGKDTSKTIETGTGTMKNKNSRGNARRENMFKPRLKMTSPIKVDTIVNLGNTPIPPAYPIK